MPYYLSEDDFASISAAYANAPAGEERAARYEAIHAIVLYPDDFGTAAAGNVIAWFGAAAQTNRGEGGASDFIRLYTKAQLEIRTGGPIPNIDDVLQQASDAIADAVWDDITLSGDEINGKTYYEVPTAVEIGRNDAVETLATLSAFSDDPGIWSGNPLYLGLGEAEFYEQNIIASSASTYDFFVMRKAFEIAGFSDDVLTASGIFDIARLFLSQGSDASDGAATTRRALNDTKTWLTEAYGVFTTDVLGNPLLDGPEELLTSYFWVGSDGGDSAIGPAQPDLTIAYEDMLHGGGGDDTLVGSMGRDILDGGAGFDTATYAVGGMNDEAMRVWLGDYQSARPFSATVQSQETLVGLNVGDSNLYSIESLTLGAANDVVHVEQFTTVTQIDAGGNDEGRGDTLSLASFDTTAGVTVDLTAQDTRIEFDGVSLEIRNFENVIGTGEDDILTGDEHQNRLAGGAGQDELVAKLNNTSGPDIFWGGTGADTIRLDKTDTDQFVGILVVDVPDLVNENFNDFDLTDLGLEDKINWDYIHAVVLSPDIGDSIVFSDEFVDGDTEKLLSVSPLTPNVWADEGWYVDNNTYPYQNYDAFYVPERAYVDDNWIVRSAPKPVSSHTVYFPDKAEAIAVQVQWSDDERIPYPSLGSGEFRPSDDLEAWVNRWLIAGAEISGSQITMPDSHRISVYLGTSGDDITAGTYRDETYRGTGGADSISAGSGIDTIRFVNSGAAVSLDLSAGTGTAGDAAGDTYSGIENVEGTAHADAIRGDASANVLHGGDGDDDLNGLDGDDIIHGGAGNDVIRGGNGRDTLHGGLGDDEIRGGTFADAIFGDEGNDTVFGADGKDVVDLGSGDDVFHDNTQGGQWGSDEVRGGDGADEINGGNGADFFFGDGGDDTIRGGVGADEVYGNSGNDWLDGEESDDLVSGGSGDDTIFGGSGDDILKGGGDRDRLSGGTGNDQLEGGGGADRFVFAPGDGLDRITDFEDNVDLIEFVGLSPSDISIGASGSDAVVAIGSNGEIEIAGAAGLISLSDMDFV